MKLSEDQKILISASSDQTVKAFNLETRQVIGENFINYTQSVMGLALQSKVKDTEQDSECSGEEEEGGEEEREIHMAVMLRDGSIDIYEVPNDFS